MQGLSPFGAGMRALPLYGETHRRINRFAGWAACFLIAAAMMTAAHGSAAAREVKLLAFGDSLTAGYGLPKTEGFTAQLEAALRADGLEVTVINAGVSGDTSAGGRSRVAWALSDGPDAVILELGANDGLRGIEPSVTRENLDAILAQLGGHGVPVLLAGMLAPPNLGKEYGEEFRVVFTTLSEAHDVVFYPFFLDGVAGVPSLNQDDGIHLNAEGVRVVVERILPAVKKLLAKVEM